MLSKIEPARWPRVKAGSLRPMIVSLLLRRWRFRIVLAATVLCPWALPAQAVPVTGSMPEDYLPGLKAILAEALNLSPRMLDQRVAYAQAEAARHAAEAALYPTVSGSASYSSGNSSVSTAGRDSSSSSSGLYYGLNLSQNLFSFGSVKAGADIGRIGEKIAANQYVEAYRALSTAIRGQYLWLIYKKASLLVSRRQLELQESDFKDLQVSIARGEIPPAALGAAEVLLERVRLNFDLQIQDFANSKRLLIKLAGIASLADEDIPGAIPQPGDPTAAAASLLGSFLRGKVEQTPMAQVMAGYARQSALRVTVTKSATRPRFSLGGGYGLNNSTSVDGVGNLSQAAVGSRSYSVSMGWTLWDSGATKWNTKSAQAAKSTSERALNTYLETNRDDAQQREKQVGFSYRTMILAERDLNSALGGLEREKQNLELGLSPKIVVDRTELSYKSTELAALYSRVAFLQQWADFVTLVDADPVTQNLPVSFQIHGQ